MPGVDPEVLELIDPELTLGRICRDLRSDFILAPHYSSIFAHFGDVLWDQVKSNLKSGNFEPELPITIEVPKVTGLTRPGSILKPADRFIYQALVDVIAPSAESNIDRSRVFSSVLLQPDPECRMFEDHNKCWNQLQERIKEYAENENFPYAIRADVANFFERLYQHVLINLLHQSNSHGGAVNLLELLLSAWMEKDSHGILQGMYPSDFLGNFYLIGLDSNLEVLAVPSARYVDDLYIFYTSKNEAQKGMTELCRSLRREGLHLNDRKSKVMKSQDLIYEETQIDRMFEEARAELEVREPSEDWYGFQSIWLEEEENELSEEEIELHAVESLYERVYDPEVSSDRIELFCLPNLAEVGSTIAVNRSLDGILERPHLAKVYSSYLYRLAHYCPSIGPRLESILNDGDFSYDWQMMWPIAALLNLDRVDSSTVTRVIQILRNHSLSIALRALCAIFIGKHGNPGQRRILIQQYTNEPSDCVRGAILFAVRFFPPAERRNCLKAWSGHSKINTLIGKAVQKIVQ